MGKSKWCTIFLSVQPNRLRVKYFDKVIFSVLLLILTKEKSRIAWFWMESGNLLLPWVEFESPFLGACINIFQNFFIYVKLSFTMFVKKIIVFILPGSTHEFLFRISVELIKSLNEVLKIFTTHVLADENSFQSWNVIHCSLIEYYFWMGNFQILWQKKPCNWIKAGVKKSFPTHPPCYTCLTLISSNWVQSLRSLFSFMVVDTMIVATSII